MNDIRKPRMKHKINKTDVNDDIITFDTAKLAKEKGCVIENTVVVYDAQGDLTLDIGVNNEDIGMDNESYDAPAQSLVQKWLRDIHNLHIIIDKDDNDDWSGRVYNLKQLAPRQSVERTHYGYQTYETALEMCLLLGLNLIKS